GGSLPYRFRRSRALAEPAVTYIDVSDWAEVACRKLSRGKEGSAEFADPVKRPFMPAGTQRVALRNHKPTTLVIEEGDAEMGAPNVNR
ncbi:MAG: hypothetical protein WCD04_14790, partial [Terriglobia bacterium]